MKELIEKVAELFYAMNVEPTIDSLPPLIPLVVSCVATLAVLPTISIILYIRAWRARRSGCSTFWVRRGILIATFLQATIAFLQFSSVLQQMLYWKGTMAETAVLSAMISLNLAHAVTRLNVGVVATAVCLVLLLLLPRNEPEK